MTDSKAERIRKAAAILGRKGGAAGRGDAKRRDPAMLREAGRKGAAIRWGAREKPEPILPSHDTDLD